MAARTFGDLWRQCHLEHPSVDPLLCRQWTLDAYTRACTNRRWGFLRTESQLTTRAARTVTVGVTTGLTAVTSAGLFVASDLGRQLRTGGQGIPYTIQTFTDVNGVTLDRAFAGATAPAASATIFDAYVTLPEDFDSFRSVVNPTTTRPMPWFLSREVVDFYDPNRQASDSSARMLLSHRLSAIAGQTGRLLYEWWPYPTAALSYPITYYRRPDTLADTAAFTGVLSTRAEELLAYARYRAALYPGTTEKRNPGYNPGAARMHQEEWARVVESLAMIDDDQFLQSLDVIDWRWVLGGLPMSDDLLRASDTSGYLSWPQQYY